jgi:diguanylate cyclase (GGDEF)-like protein/PAS domain S-box-containing protein
MQIFPQRLFDKSSTGDFDQHCVSGVAAVDQTIYKAAFERAAVGVALIEVTGKIIRVNQRLCELAGLSADQLKTLPFGGQIHCEDIAAREIALKNLIAGHTTEYTAERRYIRHCDGIELWLGITVSLAQTAPSEPSFLVAVVENITDRKAAECALTERVDRQQQLITLSASLPGALCSYRSFPNGTSRLEFVTPEFREVAGYSPELQDSGSSDYFRNVHPDDVGGLVRSVAAAARDSRPWCAEYRIQHPEKGLIYIEETSAPESDPDGSTVWYCFVHDVTARKLVEQKLSEQQSLCSSILETAIDAVVAVDESRNIAIFNAAAESMFMCKADDVIGKPYSVLVARRHLRAHRRFFSKLVAAPNDRSAKPNVHRLQGARSNGQEFPIEMSMSHTAAGGKEIITAILRDVTERDCDEAQLRQAAAVFENSQEAIAITNRLGRIMAVNPSFNKMSGLNEGDVLDRKLTVLRSARSDVALYRQIAESVAVTGTWQGEASVKRVGGGRTPQWIVVSSVRDANGKPVSYVVSFVDISRIKQTEMRLNRLALHDTLTGLPNRHLLNHRLGAALERSQEKERLGAVLFIDLDRFKTVNDSLGHKAGDELLCCIAKRLKQRVRGSDTVARLGGDEFVIVLEGIDSPDNACKVAQKIINTVEEPVTLSSGHEVYVSASIGISFFPTDGDVSDTLIQRADTALYVAKGSGRGDYRLYDPSLTVAANEKLETETRMRRALLRNEFLLHYQPIIDLQNNRVVGAEALIRWNDPLHGFVQPLSFIPLAEETGFIVPLGEWVIRNACKQFKEWRQSGVELEMLSINLSARQFRQADLPERIEMILEEMGISAGCVEFEITESALMEEGPDAMKKLAALKKVGVRLSIDDFGTGYSSLSCLKRFPLDTLKIDRSFVRDVSTDEAARQITLAIISLAKTLKLQLVAEGVETIEQASFLRSKGCDMVQGFHYSKPLEPTDFVNWLSQWPGRKLRRAG